MKGGQNLNEAENRRIRKGEVERRKVTEGEGGGKAEQGRGAGVRDEEAWELRGGGRRAGGRRKKE